MEYCLVIRKYKLMTYAKHKLFKKYYVKQKKPHIKKCIFYLCKVQEQAEVTYDDRSQKNGDFWRWGE